MATVPLDRDFKHDRPVADIRRHARLLLRKRAGDRAEGLAQDAAIGRRHGTSLELLLDRTVRFSW